MHTLICVVSLLFVCLFVCMVLYHQEKVRSINYISMVCSNMSKQSVCVCVCVCVKFTFVIK